MGESPRGAGGSNNRRPIDVPPWDAFGAVLSAELAERAFWRLLNSFSFLPGGHV